MQLGSNSRICCRYGSHISARDNTGTSAEPERSTSRTVSRLTFNTRAISRIREYYVTARFVMTPEEYDAQGSRSSFRKPFDALEPNESPNAQKAAADLRSDAKELEKRRKVRNTIVHEVASRQGRNALISLRSHFSKRNNDAKSRSIPDNRSEADHP